MSPCSDGVDMSHLEILSSTALSLGLDKPSPIGQVAFPDF